MTQTPTPRTDAEWQSITVSAPWDAAAEQMAQQARQLERELAEWREMIEREVGTLREDLAAERALADRLAGVLALYDADTLAGETMQWVPAHDEALAAWKGARNAQA